VLSQRLYITTRTFDAYITSSLGLPRNFRAIETPGHFAEAHYISDKTMLAVASANVELLEILSNMREKMFFTDAVARKGGSAIIALDQLEELSKTLDEWAFKYNVSARTSDAGFADFTKSVQSREVFSILSAFAYIIMVGHQCFSSTHNALCFSRSTAQSSTTW